MKNQAYVINITYICNINKIKTKMSTTFGIVVDGEVTPIARRLGGPNGAEITFTNPLASMLPNDTPVEAMDNSPQGIHTIGDIKEHIRKRKTNQRVELELNTFGFDRLFLLRKDGVDLTQQELELCEQALNGELWTDQDMMDFAIFYEDSASSVVSDSMNYWKEVKSK